MGIAEGTTLGVLTIASLIFVWAAIREQERERAQQDEEERTGRRQLEQDDTWNT
jgi:hypothetical protein